MKYLCGLGIGVPIVLLALFIYLSLGFVCLVDFIYKMLKRKDKNYGSFFSMQRWKSDWIYRK